LTYPLGSSEEYSLAKRAKPAELEIPVNGDISNTPLPKARTGISGLDEISGGGLPRGRTTIVCGGPGCGKTMLGMEFLIRGAQEFDEPGVLVAFEETPQEMERNVASLGFDLKTLVDRKKLFLDYIFVEPSEIQETGDYDLEGLFIRLQHAVDSIGAGTSAGAETSSTAACLAASSMMCTTGSCRASAKPAR
jgi:KaiC/GvpD/RAD55 family RecA-like ATPase